MDARFVGTLYKVCVWLYNGLGVLFGVVAIGALLGTPALVRIIRFLNVSYSDCFILIMVLLVGLMIQFHAEFEKTHEG